MTDPLGLAGDPNHTTTYVYNSFGNLIRLTTPSPGGSQPGSLTTYTPNAQGQIQQIQDPLNNQINILYCSITQSNCPYGMIYRVLDASAQATTYSYDGRGNMLSVTDAMNNVTQYQ